MKITLEILLHFINDLDPHIIKRTKQETSIIGVQRFYFSEYTDAYLKERSEYLYLANLSELVAAGDQITEDMILIASQDDLLMQDDVIGQIPCTLVLVDHKYQVHYLINRIHNIFQFFADWDKDMHIAALEGKSIQDLLDISESVLANPAIIFDACFDVIAYTRKVTSDYQTFQKTIKKGYTDAETMQQVKKQKIFSKLKKGKILVAPAVDNPDMSNLYVSFYDNQAIIGYACIFLDKVAPDPGYFDMLEIFVENLGFSLRRDYKNRIYGQMMYETFLLNLVNPVGISSEQLAEQVKNMDGLSQNGKFVLGVFSFEEEVPLSFLARTMAQEMYDVKPFIYGSQLCLLRVVQDSNGNLRSISAFEQRNIEHVLETYPYTLGLSHEFHDLMDLQYAFRQAQVAIRYGKAEGRTLCFYSDYYYYDLFEVMEEKMPVEKLKDELYLQLQEYDRRHKARYLNLIMTYLACDCNATHAAERLFLHRNSVRKSVQFVEENWEVSLNDLEVKKKLVLSEMADKYLRLRNQI